MFFYPPLTITTAPRHSEQQRRCSVHVMNWWHWCCMDSRRFSFWWRMYAFSCSYIYYKEIRFSQSACSFNLALKTYLVPSGIQHDTYWCVQERGGERERVCVCVCAMSRLYLLERVTSAVYFVIVRFNAVNYCKAYKFLWERVLCKYKLLFWYSHYNLALCAHIFRILKLCVRVCVCLHACVPVCVYLHHYRHVHIISMIVWVSG